MIIGMLQPEKMGVKGSRWLIFNGEGDFCIADHIQVRDTVRVEKETGRGVTYITPENARNLLKLQSDILCKNDDNCC